VVRPSRRSSFLGDSGAKFFGRNLKTGTKQAKAETNRQAKSCGKAAPWKPLETGVPTALGNPAKDPGFPLFAQLQQQQA
jgi:hypothetical protein